AIDIAITITITITFIVTLTITVTVTSTVTITITRPEFLIEDGRMRVRRTRRTPSARASPSTTRSSG
ncbi:MAG: hypothetical protein ACKPKO_09865, partial [Candidatus Fonsibacter sp.]